MSEFKFVQWGKGTPVDYQRLNAMMLNEQYLKDVLDNAPRGVLLWKKDTGASSGIVNPTGGVQPVVGFQDLVFDVEENRLITAEFFVGQTYKTLVGTSEVRYLIYIDGTNVAQAGTGGSTADQFGTSTVFWASATPLSKGTHSISIFVVANLGTYNIDIGGNSDSINLIVRDEGKFISATA